MGSIDKFCDRMRWWCDEGNLGYDQSNRWDFRYGGECDCSSLVIHCLQEAGFDTGDASYTGDMADELCARGWKRVPVDGHPRKGDIILNEGCHVIACIDDDGTCAWASIDESGNARGGQGGDQSGRETLTGPYYEYRRGWDCYLRYDGAMSSGPNASDSAEVQLYTPNGTPAQKWSVSWDGEYATFTSVSCGKCLDVYDEGTASGTKVWAFEPNGTDAQKWKVVRKDMGYRPEEANPVEIVPKANESLRLDCVGAGTSSGTSICVYTENDTPAQFWQILDQGDGTWIIVNTNSSLVLDVVGGGN